jgi:hypothetical protein
MQGKASENAAAATASQVNITNNFFFMPNGQQQ